VSAWRGWRERGGKGEGEKGKRVGRGKGCGAKSGSKR